MPENGRVKDLEEVLRKSEVKLVWEEASLAQEVTLPMQQEIPEILLRVESNARLVLVIPLLEHILLFSNRIEYLRSNRRRALTYHEGKA